MTPVLQQPAAHHLVVETGGDEFPVASSRPELSWQLPADATEQTSVDLEADIAGETFEFSAESAENRFVAWPWRALRSGEAVTWRVRVHGPGITPTWSDRVSFEAGLFEEDWTARWVSAPPAPLAPLGERPAVVFSTTFELDGTHEGARLYSAALGVYEISVNGQRAGSSELAPGSESYDRTLYAQAADASPLLRAGTNTVEIVLTDGWYRGRVGAFRHQAAWGEQLAVRAELRIGAETITATDLGWRVRSSDIVQADLMDGQTTDFRVDAADLGAPIPGPDGIPPVTWSPAPPVRVIAELAPVGISRLNADVAIVDFGQNASGRVRLSSLGPAGTRTVLDFGEHVGPDGDLTLDHLGVNDIDGTFVALKQRDIVIADGDPSSYYEPHHTVHGFQYVRVEREGGLNLDAAQITMQVLHTDLRPVGSFTSNDADLNRLYEVADWSFRGNAVDVPTDCPTRERAGWTGDWQVFLPTAVRLYDVDGFSRKWLQSVRDDQLDDGRIVNISPDNARLRVTADPMLDMATGSAGWGDAIVLVPWELYRTYGDKTVLHENWDAMARWVRFALRAAAEHRHPVRVARSQEPLAHEKYLWDGTFHFGEWLEPVPLREDGTPGSTMPDPVAWATADKGEVGTAYLYRSLATLAQIADVLGRRSDASELAETAENVRAAWRTEFLQSDGRTSVNTQASYVRALAFDLVPGEMRARVADHLVREIHAADTHLTTGFLSTADLLPVLADTGHSDVAEALLHQRTTPSWLGMIDRGATTIWEEWEGIDRNGNAHASLNHYSKGAVIRYLQTHTLGLQQAADSVAWKRFVLKPTPSAQVSTASGHFDGPQGTISASWSKDDGGMHVSLTVPGGSSATVMWNGMSHDFGPGAHCVTME